MTVIFNNLLIIIMMITIISILSIIKKYIEKSKGNQRYIQCGYTAIIILYNIVVELLVIS